MNRLVEKEFKVWDEFGGNFGILIRDHPDSSDSNSDFIQLLYFEYNEKDKKIEVREDIPPNILGKNMIKGVIESLQSFL